MRALVVVLLLALAAPLRAQRVVVEQRVLMTDGRTPAQARRLAREEAMAEAVRQVVGVRVTSHAVATTVETPDRVTSEYRSLVLLDAAGRVTDAELLAEAWESRTVPDLGPQLYYQARYALSVQRDSGVPDPAFSVALALEHDDLVAPSTRLDANDEVLATITSTRAAHLVLFSVDGDTIERLIPNDFSGPVAVAANQSVTVPDATWRARGLRFRVTRDPAQPVREEWLVVVALRRGVPPPPARATWLELNRWLAGIPAHERAMATAGYRVRSPGAKGPGDTGPR